MCEDARRIAAASGALAARNRDLAQRGGAPREAVDDNQHVQTAFAQRTGVHESYFRGGDPLGCRTIARSANDRRTLVTPFEPLLRLTSAFSDERDDDRIRAAALNDPLEQRRLAASGRPEDPDTRAAPKRQQRIDRANARPERLDDRYALVRKRRPQRNVDQSARQGLPSVERNAACVDSASERAGA
jgi:hypothetical protein